MSFGFVFLWKVRLKNRLLCDILHSEECSVGEVSNIINRSETKIKRTFMKDEAYEVIRKWIISGDLAPGEKLRDKELSATLGLSRTPIREALLMLENDGLVETKANRWTLVAPIDLSKAEETYVIVSTLECLALRLAINSFTDADVQELEKLNENLNDLIDNGDRISALEADNAFHNKMIRMAKNEELQKLLVNLKLKIQRIESHYFSQKEFLQTAYIEHNQIIEAIRNKDLKEAEEALKANWNNSLDRLRQKEKLSES